MKEKEKYYNALTSLGVNVILQKTKTSGEMVILGYPSTVKNSSVYLICHLNGRGEICNSRTYIYTESTKKAVLMLAKQDFHKWGRCLMLNYDETSYETLS